MRSRSAAAASAACCISERCASSASRCAASCACCSAILVASSSCCSFTSDASAALWRACASLSARACAIISSICACRCSCHARWLRAHGRVRCCVEGVVARGGIPAEGVRPGVFPGVLAERVGPPGGAVAGGAVAGGAIACAPSVVASAASALSSPSSMSKSSPISATPRAAAGAVAPAPGSRRHAGAGNGTVSVGTPRPRGVRSIVGVGRRMAFTAAVSSSGTRAAVSGVRLETPPGTPGVNMLNAGEDAGAEKGLPSAGAAGVFDPRGDEVTFDEGARHEETFSSGTGASSFSGTTGASTRGPPRRRPRGRGLRPGGLPRPSPPRRPSTAVVSIPSKSEVRVSADHSSVSVSAGWECSEATVAGVRAGGGGIVASASASACSSPRVPSSASSSPASPTARVLGPVEGAREKDRVDGGEDAPGRV